MAFTVTHERAGDDAVLILVGDLDASSAPSLREAIELAADPLPKRLVLQVSELSYMASAGLRTLVFARQKMGEGVEIILVQIQPSVRETLELTGFQQSVTMVDVLD